jgi:hypothetical protein
LHDDAMWVYGGMTDLQERADFWRWDTGEINIHTLKPSLYHVMKEHRGHGSQLHTFLTFTLVNREMIGLMHQSTFARQKYPVSLSIRNQEDPRTVLNMYRPTSLLSYPYSFSSCL